MTLEILLLIFLSILSAAIVWLVYELVWLLAAWFINWRNRQKINDAVDQLPAESVTLYERYLEQYHLFWVDWRQLAALYLIQLTLVTACAALTFYCYYWKCHAN